MEDSQSRLLWKEITKPSLFLNISILLNNIARKSTFGRKLGKHRSLVHGEENMSDYIRSWGSHCHHCATVKSFMCQDPPQEIYL